MGNHRGHRGRLTTSFYWTDPRLCVRSSKKSWDWSGPFMTCRDIIRGRRSNSLHSDLSIIWTMGFQHTTVLHPLPILSFQTVHLDLLTVLTTKEHCATDRHHTGQGRGHEREKQLGFYPSLHVGRRSRFCLFHQLYRSWSQDDVTALLLTWFKVHSAGLTSTTSP